MNDIRELVGKVSLYEPTYNVVELRKEESQEIPDVIFAFLEDSEARDKFYEEMVVNGLFVGEIMGKREHNGSFATSKDTLFSVIEEMGGNPFIVVMKRQEDL